MKIDLTEFGINRNYFCISIGNRDVYSGKSISKLLNLDVDTFNQILIDKVVKHKNYYIYRLSKDIEFDLCNVSKEIYIERFKNIFTEQLTLLTLGGIHSNEN